MDKLKELRDKLLAAWAKTEPFRRTTAMVCGKIANVIWIIWKWIYRLRSVILSIPVGIVAFKLALDNSFKLPEQVGILLLSNGDYQWVVERSTAVTIPLVVTGICLAMMFLSRRVVYPWVISIFSLVLPFVIYITNVFPA